MSTGERYRFAAFEVLATVSEPRSDGAPVIYSSAVGPRV